MENTSSLVAVLIAVISAFAAIGGGIFTYRASSKQTTTEADTKRIDQVIEGMQKIIDNLTRQNEFQAKELSSLRDQLLVIKQDLNNSEIERIKALKDLGVLEEKYQHMKERLQTKHVLNGDSEVI